MADDIAFAELSIQAAMRIGTDATGLLSPLHTCLMAEKAAEIQAGSRVTELMETGNNTSLTKHLNLTLSVRSGADYHN